MTTRKFVGLAQNEKRHEYVVLTGIVQKEGRNWVATIVETGTTAQARTIPDLMDRLNEALDLHLSTLEAVGELERFLNEQGMAVYKFEPKSPRLEVKNITPGSLATAIVKGLPESTPNPGRDHALVEA